MECGGEGLAVLGWLSEHLLLPEQTIAWLRPFLCSSLFKALTDPSKVIALLTSTYAAWQGWCHREAVLHKRLDEYINESDERLARSRADVVALISRPDRRTNLKAPAYALELKHILQRQNWEPALHSGRASTAMTGELQKTTERITKRTDCAERALTSLRQQQATADTIKAALSAGKALQSRVPAIVEKHNQEALAWFEQVLSVSGHQRDLIALEGKALQLLRLGQREGALAAFQNVEAIANDHPDPKRRALIISRAKRFQAQIRQVQSLNGGSLAAWGLLVANNPSAVSLLKPHSSSFRDWDLIEHAEIHYVTAFVANRLNFGVQEPEYLSAANSCYDRVIAGVPKRRLLMSSAQRRQHSAAREGLDRVQRVQAAAGDYDLPWLFQPAPPPSNNPQQPPKPVS